MLSLNSQKQLIKHHFNLLFRSINKYLYQSEKYLVLKDKVDTFDKSETITTSMINEIVEDFKIIIPKTAKNKKIIQSLQNIIQDDNEKEQNNEPLLSTYDEKMDFFLHLITDKYDNDIKRSFDKLSTHKKMSTKLQQEISFLGMECKNKFERISSLVQIEKDMSKYLDPKICDKYERAFFRLINDTMNIADKMNIHINEIRSNKFLKYGMQK